MRNSIYSNFQAVNAQADAIPFEFGPRRDRHMAARAHIRRWQPSLRTLYLMLVASLQHRIFGADSDFPKPLLDAQDRFNRECARMLDVMAARLEGQPPVSSVEELQSALRSLEGNLAQAATAASGAAIARAEGLLVLSRRISPLLENLFVDVLSTPSAAFVKV